MIASNYISTPQVLRFQRELFSNGYHNSPRIMRLVEAIFYWKPTVPQWFIDFRNRAKRLARAVKKALITLFPTTTTQRRKP